MARGWHAALGTGREPSTDQVAAILAPPHGRHSVNAGAGTGKTSTLALRAVYLIEAGHLRADEIVVVTFTKKASAEIGSRIADTLDRAIANGAQLSRGGRGVNCTTIHALAADLLREFAFEFGSVTTRAITDGEAHAIFQHAFRALLDDRLGVDAHAFPIAEMNLETLERDLGKLALRLKNHGIAPHDFETRALAQADRLASQTWGQLWTNGSGKRSGRQKDLDPKVSVSAQARSREAQRERANIRVVSALLCEFDRRLAAAGAATYGDLIGNATRLLLQRPELVTRLRARWRYLLLDESQDTSALQLAFIETLFGQPAESDAAGMMPVGDTRQAIYGFNGADERVMERLALSADASHPLVVNRRSPQEIVDAGHAVLVDAGIIDAQTPLLEAFAGNAGFGCVRVENFGADNETIKQRVEREAAAIAREVTRLLSEGAQDNEIAILVRRRTHAAAYVRALNERGIAAALDRRSGLFVAAEIRDLLAWMALLVDLGNRQAAVRVLQSPLVGISDAALISLAARDDWIERFLRGDVDGDLDIDTRMRLAAVREHLTVLLPNVALPVDEALAAMLTELPIAASYVRLGQTVGASAIGAQAIVNLRSFAQLTREFADERPGARLREFVDDAERRIRYDDDPQEAELELDGVRVLTIHQAKGLEWPYVFVACSTRNQYGNAEPTDRVVGYDLDSGAFGLKNDVDGRETLRWLIMRDEHDPDTGERVVQSRRAMLAEREQARVFYVAITRAKRRVYVTAPVPHGGAEARYLASIRAWAESTEPGVDLRFDTVALAATAESATMTSSLPPASRVTERIAAVAEPPAAVVRPRLSFTAIAAFQQCPRRARLQYRLLLPDLRESRPRLVAVDTDADVSATNAARLGSLAHRTLEFWGRAVIAGQPIALDDAFAAARLEFADATQAEEKRAVASARHALEALAGYTLLAVETPFEIVFGEVRVEGVIDLIARDANGRLFVIDYKTGRTEDEHYALQLTLYRRVAQLRYPHDCVDAAILRLRPEGASFAPGAEMPADEFDRAIAAVGRFESNVAKVGTWCDFCAYRGSPCMAPLQAADTSDLCADRSATASITSRAG